ncbi:DUF2628 domain-containing protein [Lactobacillus juensis]|uniref:DUF2628 domain-containing protein n=1 Tax=Lactobacillus juensis TaxID=3082862 RepID=UPI0030C72F06
MKANLKSDKTGVIKQVKVGASWTALFFGAWVPIFRGDWKFAILFGIIQLLEFCSFGIIGLIIRIVTCVKYNSWYISELLNNGYSPADKTSEQVLRQKGLYLI